MNSYKVSENFIKFTVLKRIFMVLLLALMTGLVVCAIGAGTLLVINNNGKIVLTPSVFLWIFIVVFITALSSVFYSVYWCKSFTFNIDEQTTNMKGGIFRKIDAITPFEKITDVAITQDFLAQIFHFADILVQTAGSPSVEVMFFGVDDQKAQEIKNILFEKISKNKQTRL
jgi:uncharacterized membrane protein YdbT with pleckstrin-like domain